MKIGKVTPTAAGSAAARRAANSTDFGPGISVTMLRPREERSGSKEPVLSKDPKCRSSMPARFSDYAAPLRRRLRPKSGLGELPGCRSGPPEGSMGVGVGDRGLDG